MTSALPPYPYFNGIGFNPSYFSSTYITQDQANKLYLLKAYPDKAIAKETFSAGIVASSITTNNGNLIMGTGQITCGNITSSSGGFGTGSITANGGVKTQLIDVIATGSDLTIGGNQDGGAISIGGGKTSGFITLGNPGNSSQSVIMNAPALFHQGITLDNSTGISSNSYLLNGTTPTITKSSLGYYVNYAYTTANISSNQTYYLYSPLINSTTTADNYLSAGYYLVNMNSSVFDKNTPTGGTSNYTLGVCYGTTTSASAIPTNAQYGTLGPTTAIYSYSMLGINSINIGNGLSFGFNLPADGFVNIQLKIIMTNPTNFGSFCYNVNGCIRRIA
jgi:hypothetical protein